MSNQENSVQFSRRRFLQISTARVPQAGNLDAVARTAEITEAVLNNPSATVRFVNTIRSIFARTFKPEAPDIFKDRPEEVELSPRDRAINAVIDLLQPHVSDLTKWRLDPQVAIESIADYLVAMSQGQTFNAAIVMASPDNALYEIYTIHDDPPSSLTSNDLFDAAIRLKAIRLGEGGALDTPGLQYEAEQDRSFKIS